MADRNLSRLLEQLHEELENMEVVDEKGRDLLRSLDADIQKILGHPNGTKTASDDSMLQRLQDAVDHFEVTHPALTAAISEITTILSNAGI